MLALAPMRSRHRPRSRVAVPGRSRTNGEPGTQIPRREQPDGVMSGIRNALN